MNQRTILASSPDTSVGWICYWNGPDVDTALERTAEFYSAQEAVEYYRLLRHVTLSARGVSFLDTEIVNALRAWVTDTVKSLPGQLAVYIESSQDTRIHFRYLDQDRGAHCQPDETVEICRLLLLEWNRVIQLLNNNKRIQQVFLTEHNDYRWRKFMQPCRNDQQMLELMDEWIAAYCYVYGQAPTVSEVRREIGCYYLEFVDLYQETIVSYCLKGTIVSE